MGVWGRSPHGRENLGVQGAKPPGQGVSNCGCAGRCIFSRSWARAVVALYRQSSARTRLELLKLVNTASPAGKAEGAVNLSFDGFACIPDLQLGSLFLFVQHTGPRVHFLYASHLPSSSFAKSVVPDLPSGPTDPDPAASLPAPRETYMVMTKVFRGAWQCFCCRACICLGIETYCKTYCLVHFVTHRIWRL